MLSLEGGCTAPASHKIVHNYVIIPYNIILILLITVHLSAKIYTHERYKEIIFYSARGGTNLLSPFSPTHSVRDDAPFDAVQVKYCP